MVPEHGTDEPTDSTNRESGSDSEGREQSPDELEYYQDEDYFESEEDLSPVNRTDLLEKMFGFSQETIEKGELDWDNYEPEPEGSEERNSGEDQGPGDILQSSESNKGEGD